mgnify:CR=1 FL=1
MNKTESAPDPVPPVTPADWETLHRSVPADYDGHTGFDRMSPAARFAWLEAAAVFVSQHAQRLPALPAENPK